MKVGLLGGSFDPIHDGHLLIAKTALKKLDLDEVWFLPVLNNPFKGTNMASGDDRIAMIEIACRKEERFKVNDIELKGNIEEKSYTYNTLVKLKEQYPDVRFYYIIGQDQVNHFEKWYKAKQISEICQLVCLDRGGYESKSDNIKDFNMKKLKVEPIEASSTAIRNGDFTHCDKKVIRYFTMHGLYLDSIIKKYMGEARYIHTINMASLAVEIAEANGLDPMKAYVAGMLHDVAKEMDNKKAEKIMDKHFSEYKHMARPIWHQWLSAYVAKKTFHVKDEEILQAIINHTTANTNMSLLDMCIYCADKYDRSRGYDSSKEIELCKQDIRLGFAKSLSDFYEFSTKKGREIDPIFFEVYKKYGGYDGK